MHSMESNIYGHSVHPLFLLEGEDWTSNRILKNEGEGEGG